MKVTQVHCDYSYSIGHKSRWKWEFRLTSITWESFGSLLSISWIFTTQYFLSSCVCPSVCLSQVDVLQKTAKWSYHISVLPDLSVVPFDQSMSGSKVKVMSKVIWQDAASPLDFVSPHYARYVRPVPPIFTVIVQTVYFTYVKVEVMSKVMSHRPRHSTVSVVYHLL